MASVAKSPLPWFGGKQYLVSDLLALLPPHDFYVEAYGGAATLLLSKPPAALDVYNDLDSGLVNFFRVLRDRRRCAELVELLRLTPYAREEWEECHAGWRQAGSDVEMARQWYVAVVGSFGKHLMNSGWSYSRQSGHSKAVSFRSTIQQFDRFTDRLQTVQIEHLPALDLLRRYDAPNALFYLDPPYVLSSRRDSDRRYQHEMTDGDHRALLQVLQSMRGMVVLSGYRSALYDEALFGWHRIDVDYLIATQHVRGHKRQHSTECIWLNPAAQRRQRQLSLFAEAGYG